ncbi:hypothetical protein SKAU_G00278230 [Synaphobranchus kaupii]|uniref:ribonuclease H n=1 Tax=Synaphobranchus kaupii TaxID=118154 RepID=A0A9Q1EWM8_SYNKA|nr:hypothetical protein SKAU_G00278230 [Synaphobranchus kaupii]
MARSPRVFERFLFAAFLHRQNWTKFTTLRSSSTKAARLPKMDYQDAVCMLNTLQTNASALEQVRRERRNPQLQLQAMRAYLQRSGLAVSHHGNKHVQRHRRAHHCTGQADSGMERALLREIEELERSISELTRRKARRAGAMTSPEWQTPAVQVSRRPDGFSGRQENPASVSRDGTLAKPTMQLKLPRFNGTASLESYLAQLELAAELGGWTPEQTAGHLALALEGPALEAILDLPPAERQNLQALTAALQRRFIQHRSAEASQEKLLNRYRCEEESWGKVAADIQHYAREAYPDFDAAAQEKLVLHAFLRALTPERLRDHVSLAQPGSISEALIKTTRAEDTLAIRPTPQPTRQHVRVADGEEVRWTRTPLQRPAGRQGRCYRYDEPGHIARDCPAPAPKPRKPRRRETRQGWRSEENAAPGTNPPQPGVLHNTGGPQLPGAWTPTATPLTSVTGAKMAMRGKKEVKVTVSGQEVSHKFWLADIADSCIIGLDLLKRWGACVDVSRASITLGTETVALKSGPTMPQPDHSLAHHHQSATQQPPAQPKPALPAETTAAVHALWQRSSSGFDHQQRQQLKSLLDGNADLFAVRDEDCTQTELVQHTINTDTAQPIRLRPHRMSPAKRLVAEEKKKSGEWRFCVDYRRLNSATTKDSYPLPRIDEALDHISGSNWFSSLDLRSGYWQMRLAPEAKPKTAFTIGQGLWQFRVMPFGLCNAPATFERLMERVLAAVPRSRCVVYLDDLLAGLRLNPKKCQLLRRETAFLGHSVATDPSKVAAVGDWPVPGYVGELRSFLGLASYYRRFVRDFGTLASPFHRLTDKCRPFV